MKIIERLVGANDYPVTGWIVTGSIFSSEIKLFRGIANARKYAKQLHKELKEYPGDIVIEWRTSDQCVKSGYSD